MILLYFSEELRTALKVLEVNLIDYFYSKETRITFQQRKLYP